MSKIIKDGFPEDFNQFWEAYPKRMAKADAYKAWLQMGSYLPSIDELARAIHAQSLGQQWQSGFIPYPASWLRGMRWLDEMEITLPKVDQKPSLPSWMADGKG